MEIRDIINQHELDIFIGSQPRSQFLQSWPWGEFQRQLPSRVIRLGVFAADQLVGSVQLIERMLPLGRKYWYVPRGPVVSSQLSVDRFQMVFRQLVDEIMKRAEKDGVMFVRCEPPIERSSQHLFDTLTSQYRRQMSTFVQPQDSLYLDVRRSEEQLLSAMHPKTRYNIKLAEKKGVTIRTAAGIDDFDAFWKLMEVTAKRDRFQQHSRSYYRDMYRLLGQTKFIKLYFAEYNGTVIAANLVVSFGDTVTYLHGASADEYREVMAPHLLQWRQIQEAKKQGAAYYDFWGIAPSGAKADHPWAGITRFKRGFGGVEISYLGVYDLILDTFWYRMYRTVQRIRI